MQQIIAVIPARGGSKGLKMKNLRLLSGHPLISYTINSAIKSKYISKVIVSTDNEEIRDVSLKYGAEVIMRPSEYASDDCPSIYALLHVIETMEKRNEVIDTTVFLQPTSPFRTNLDIDAAIELFNKNGKETLVSVCEFEHSPYWSFKIVDNCMVYVFEKEHLIIRRQALDKIYRPNGAIYINTVSSIKRNKSFYCDTMIPYIMPKHTSVDIDDEFDLLYAEYLMNNFDLLKKKK